MSEERRGDMGYLGDGEKGIFYRDGESDPMDCIAHQALLSMEFSRQEYWNG